MRNNRMVLNGLLMMVLLASMISCSQHADLDISKPFVLVEQGENSGSAPISANVVQPNETSRVVSPTSTLTPQHTPTVQNAYPAIEATSGIEVTPEWYQKVEAPNPVTVYSYGMVSQPKSPIYTDLIDAVKQDEKFRSSSNSALVYYSYSDIVVVNGETYYRVGADEWMRQEAITPSTYSDFSGLINPQTTTAGLGWVIADTQSILINPDSGEQSVGYDYKRFDVFRVIGIQEQGSSFLYEIAEGEWLPEDNFSYMNPTSQPPTQVKDCHWIEVSLSQQNLAVYDNCQVVFATLISSGKNSTWTSPGIYYIGRKEEYITLSDLNPGNPDSYYLEDVPWVMYYAGTWAIHAAYWHSNFGYPASHGCITLSPADARYLYSLTQYGDVLRIVQ